MNVAYDERFWDCRDFGHAWKFRSCIVLSASPVEFERVFRCLRGCKTERVERIARDGLISRNYRYQEGYQLSKNGSGQVVDRGRLLDEVRMSNLRRQAGVPLKGRLRVVA